MPMILGGSGTINTSSSLAVAVAGVEDVRIDANGNVGIGTTLPGGKFHIQDTSNRDGTGHIMAENINTGTAGATNSQILTKNRFGASQFMQWENNGVRIGSRWTANSGGGNVYITSGGDAVNMTIDSSGRVTKPNQPAFHAYPSVAASVVVNTAFPINVAPENQGNCYNTSTYRFTAPVTGRYLFTFFTLTANDGTTVDIRLWVNGSNPDLYGGYSGNQTGHKQVTSTWLVRLNVNDYVEVRSAAAPSYMFGVPHTGFSGFLIG